MNPTFSFFYTHILYCPSFSSDCSTLSPSCDYLLEFQNLNLITPFFPSKTTGTWPRVLGFGRRRFWRLFHDGVDIGLETYSRTGKTLRSPTSRGRRWSLRIVGVTTPLVFVSFVLFCYEDRKQGNFLPCFQKFVKEVNHLSLFLDRPFPGTLYIRRPKVGVVISRLISSSPTPRLFVFYLFVVSFFVMFLILKVFHLYQNLLYSTKTKPIEYSVPFHLRKRESLRNFSPM